MFWFNDDPAGEIFLPAKQQRLHGKPLESEVIRFSSELDVKTCMLRVEMNLDNESELPIDGSDVAVRRKHGFYGYATVHLNE